MRGLKHEHARLAAKVTGVAPYVGAWIETCTIKIHLAHVLVAPYVGAWIETTSYTLQQSAALVAPYVGAWIETLLSGVQQQNIGVAPYVGAWIETCHTCEGQQAKSRRTLRGCVD